MISSVPGYRPPPPSFFNVSTSKHASRHPKPPPQPTKSASPAARILSRGHKAPQQPQPESHHQQLHHHLLLRHHFHRHYLPVPRRAHPAAAQPCTQTRRPAPQTQSPSCPPTWGRASRRPCRRGSQLRERASSLAQTRQLPSGPPSARGDVSCRSVHMLFWKGRESTRLTSSICVNEDGFDIRYKTTCPYECQSTNSRIPCLCAMACSSTARARVSGASRGR
jgi:hypothetical protein